MGGIIWLASYPKSGNTWLRAFVHNLFRDAERAHDINKLTDLTAGESTLDLFRSVDPALDQHYTDEQVRLLRPQVHRFISSTSPNNVLVKTHNALVADDGAPLVTLEVTAGAVYIVRNPLDVAISFSHHNATTVDNIIEFMNSPAAATKNTERNVYEFYGTWSEHVASWTTPPSATIHVMRYEDMLERPRATFGALVKFLGLDVPPRRIEKAIRLSSFRVLKEQEQRAGFRERPPRMASFFREGKAGQWTKILTDAQVRAIVEANREQMTRFGYVPAGM
jgi:hypothetical protein